MCAPRSPSAPEPACRRVEPPGEREVRVDQPVLEVLGADVADGAEPTGLDELAGQGECWHAAVVERGHRETRGALGRGDHRDAFGDRVGERFLAQHVLALLEGGDRDRGVAVAGGADVDDVDVVAGDEGAPVGFVALPAELVRRRANPALVAAADRGQFEVGQVEEVRSRSPCLRVHGSHERVTDHANSHGVTSLALGHFVHMPCVYWFAPHAPLTSPRVGRRTGQGRAGRRRW